MTFTRSAGIASAAILLVTGVSVWMFAPPLLAAKAVHDMRSEQLTSDPKAAIGSVIDAVGLGERIAFWGMVLALSCLIYMLLEGARLFVSPIRNFDSADVPKP